MACRWSVKNAVRRRDDVRALVKELRSRLDLARGQFAQKVGVTYSTVNHCENGKRLPPPTVSHKAALGNWEDLGAEHTEPSKRSPWE
jgi:DNA-binding XRE family transcriptional regulator